MGEHVQLNFQRGAICTVAGHLVKMAERGWLMTARDFAPPVAAALVLAAKAYLIDIDIESVACKLASTAHIFERRLGELKRLLVSLLKPLPWGNMVTIENVHTYLLFAVEFAEILEPALLDLQQQR